MWQMFSRLLDLSTVWRGGRWEVEEEEEEEDEVPATHKENPPLSWGEPDDTWPPRSTKCGEPPCMR